jgi:hypothetical protein
MGMQSSDPLLAPLVADEHKEIGGVQLDAVRAGNVRLKRMIYPPGFSWATHLSAIIGSKLCQHTHVGFMARGQINVRFADGCVVEYKAPQFVVVEPGHEGWVVGNEAAVLIEVDFFGETSERVGPLAGHRHRESVPETTA